jgi:hypothetical protein
MTTRALKGAKKRPVFKLDKDEDYYHGYDALT